MVISVENENHIDNISRVISLVFFLPNLAVSVRRFHDINKSGWLYAGLYIAMIASAIMLALSALASFSLEKGYISIIILFFILIAIYTIILLATKGNIGPNQYGPDPKAPQNQNTSLKTI